MERFQPLKPIPFSPSRYEHYDNFRYYYAFGNTPAEDFLEHVLDNPCPSVLSLGCGDMRSCFYTLWKNFDPIFGNGRHFTGVKFVLNDISPAILARNVLFLYLAVKLYEQPNQREWVCAMWAIWFSHELLPNHNRILKEALVVLLKNSESMQKWRDGCDNPLCLMVDFMSESTLHKIHQCWSMWYTKFDGNAKFEWMKENRKSKVSSGSSPQSKNLGIMSTSASFSQNYHKKIANDIERYYETGCAFAEVAFNSDLPLQCERYINPTLFDKHDKYSLHYASLPYDCFHHSGFFLLTDLEESGISLQSMPFPQVKHSCFTKNPLLANCVQQFVFWVLSSATILNASNAVTFRFQCSDALVFSMQLQHNHHLFDVIYTSNLVDTLSPPAVVLSTFPLLKDEGYLLTTVFNHKHLAQNLTDYLAICFGFQPELLPAICGMRCIRQEGAYADHTVDLRHVASTEHGLFQHQGKRVRYLIWEHAKSPAYSIEKIKSTSFQFESLYSCIRDSAISIFEKCVMESVTKCNRCTQTAMLAVIAFSRIVQQSNGTVDYTFWDGLCQLLRNDKRLAPYLLHLQTQALYSNVHLHLTLTTDDCPLCTEERLEQAFTKVVVRFKPYQHRPPVFIMYIHENKADISNIPAVGPDVHIIDSSVCTATAEGEIIMESLLLSSAIMNLERYKVTVVEHVYQYNPMLCQTSFMPINRIAFNLEDCLQPLKQYYCMPNYINPNKTIESSFGKVTQCVQTRGGFITTIAISKAVMALIKNDSLLVKTTLVSKSVFQLSCLSHSIELEYYVPVKYEESTTRLSHDSSFVTVFVPLDKYVFYNDRARSIKNPDNKAVLPHKNVNPNDLSNFDKLQYTKNDSEATRICNATNIPLPSLLQIKCGITVLMNGRDSYLIVCGKNGIIEENKKIAGLIIVHSHIFDVELQTPAIDLSFYIDETYIPKDAHAFNIWSEMKQAGKTVENIFCDTEAITILKKVFQYFARRTKTQNTLLDPTFTRAVVYPLYCEGDFINVIDPNMYINFSSLLMSVATDKSKMICSSCRSIKNKDLLKMCGNCHAVWYCDRSCQVKHWNTHKVVCHKLPQKEETPSSIEEPSIEEKCSGCGKSSSISLKKCTRCKSVSYCSKECQAKDWSTHKVTCHQVPPSIEELSIEEKCSGCGKLSSVSLMKCTRCKLVSYCSKKCQRKDWPKHKDNCKN